jgi:hypothetical protein
MSWCVRLGRYGVKGKRPKPKQHMPMLGVRADVKCDEMTRHEARPITFLANLSHVSIHKPYS